MKKPLIAGSLFLAALLFASIPASSAPAGENLSGLWDATVVVNQVQIPFRFEIEQSGNNVQGFFFEGDHRVGSTSGSWKNGRLELNYDYLNTTLEATLQNGQLQGSYRYNRPKGSSLAFQAHRFAPEPVAAQENVPQVAGNWDMHRTAKDNSKLDVSWKLFLRQSGAEVSGAILKTSGDTGMLAGRWKNGTLVMSHFAGERPLLFEARLNPDGTLNITLDHKYTYRAARSSEARAKGIPEPPDPSRFTSVKDPTERFHFSGPDLNDNLISDTDPRFRDKVIVLSIGGSWCPNCHDEAPFLVSLYKEFHSRGLEVVGLNFELEPGLADARPRVEAFIRRYQIPYPILVPGTPDQVSAKLPQLVNFGVYPTTIFIGRDGRVRSVHAGFASAATGEAHVRLEREERSLVERLLAEKSPQNAQHASGGL